MRSAPSANRLGANSAASPSTPSLSPARRRPIRTSCCQSPLGRPIGGEEVAGLAFPAEPCVGGAVADGLGAAPAELAVGEAALELLQRVAAGKAAPEVERQIELRGVLDQAGDDVLHRRLAQARVGGAR